MKKLTRILAALLCAVMLLSVLPISTFAAGWTTVEIKQNPSGDAVDVTVTIDPDALVNYIKAGDKNGIIKGIVLKNDDGAVKISDALELIPKAIIDRIIDQVLVDIPMEQMLTYLDVEAIVSEHFSELFNAFLEADSSALFELLDIEAVIGLDGIDPADFARIEEIESLLTAESVKNYVNTTALLAHTELFDASALTGLLDLNDLASGDYVDVEALKSYLDPADPDLLPAITILATEPVDMPAAISALSPYVTLGELWDNNIVDRDAIFDDVLDFVDVKTLISSDVLDIDALVDAGIVDTAAFINDNINNVINLANTKGMDVVFDIDALKSAVSSYPNTAALLDCVTDINVAINTIGIETIIGIIGQDALIQQLSASGAIKDIANTIIAKKESYIPFITEIIDALQTRIDVIRVGENDIASKDEYDLLNFNSEAIIKAVAELMPTLTDLENLGDDGLILSTSLYAKYLANVTGTDIPKEKTFNVTVVLASGVAKVRAAAAKVRAKIAQYLDYSISADSIYLYAKMPQQATTLLKVIYEEKTVRGIEDELLVGLRDDAKQILLDLYETDVPGLGEKIADVVSGIALEDIVTLLENIDTATFERAYNKVVTQHYVSIVLGYVENFVHADLSSFTLDDFIEKAGDIPTIAHILDVIKNKTGIDVASFLPISASKLEENTYDLLSSLAKKFGVDIDFKEIIETAAASENPLETLYGEIVDRVAASGAIYNKVKSRALSLADRLLSSSYAEKLSGKKIGALYQGNGVFGIVDKNVTIDAKGMIKRFLDRYFDTAKAKLQSMVGTKLGSKVQSLINNLDKKSVEKLLSFVSDGSTSINLTLEAEFKNLYQATFQLDGTTVLTAFVPVGTDLTKIYPYEEGYDSSLGWKILEGAEADIGTYTEVMPAYDVTLELTVAPAVIVEVNYPSEQVVDYVIDDTTSTDEVVIIVDSAMPAEKDEMIRYTFLKSFIKQIVADGKTLVIRSDASYNDVTEAKFDATALSKALAVSPAEDTTIVLIEEVTDKTAKETKFDFNFECGSVDFGTGVVTLTLPFTGTVPANNSRWEETFVYVIGSTGTRTKTDFTFDTTAGTITFTAPHFSYFQIVTEPYFSVNIDGDQAEYTVDDAGEKTLVTVTTAPASDLTSVDLVFAKTFLEGQTKDLTVTLTDGMTFGISAADLADLLAVFGTADRLKISVAVTYPTLGETTYTLSLTDETGAVVACTEAQLALDIPVPGYVNNPPFKKTYIYLNGTLLAATDYTVSTGTPICVGLTVNLTDVIDVKTPALFSVEGDDDIPYTFDGSDPEVDVIDVTGGMEDHPYVNFSKLFFEELIASGKGLRIVFSTDGVEIELNAAAISMLYDRMTTEGIDVLTLKFEQTSGVYDFTFGVKEGSTFTPLTGGVAFESGAVAKVTLPATASAYADVLPYLYVDGVDNGLVTITDGFTTFNAPHFSTFEIRNEAVLAFYIGAGIGGGQLNPAYYTVTANDTAKVISVELASVLPVFALNTVDVIFLKDFATAWYGYSLEISSAAAGDLTKIVMPADTFQAIADTTTPADYVDFFAGFGASTALYQEGYVFEVQIVLVDDGAVAETMFGDVTVTLPIDEVYNGTDEKTFVETVGFVMDPAALPGVILVTGSSSGSSMFGGTSLAGNVPASMLSGGLFGSLVPVINEALADSAVTRDTTNNTVTFTSDGDNRQFSIVNKYYLKALTDYSVYTDGVKSDETSSAAIFTGFLPNEWHAAGEQVTIAALSMISGYESYVFYGADFFGSDDPTTAYLTLTDFTAGTTQFTMPSKAVSYKLTFSVTNYHIYVYVNGAKVADIVYQPTDSKDTVFGKLTTSVVTDNHCDAPDASFKDQIGTARVLYYFATTTETPAATYTLTFYGLDGTTVLKTATYTAEELTKLAYLADLPTLSTDADTAIYWKDAQGKDLTEYDWSAVSGTAFSFYAKAVARTYKITAQSGITVLPTSTDGYKKGETVTVQVAITPNSKTTVIYTTATISKTLELTEKSGILEVQFTMPAEDVDLKLEIVPVSTDVTYTDKDGKSATGKVGQSNEISFTIPAGKVLTKAIPEIVTDLDGLTLINTVFNPDGSITLVYCYALADGDNEQKAITDVTAATEDAKYATMYYVDGTRASTPEEAAALLDGINAEISGWSDPVAENLVFAAYSFSEKEAKSHLLCWILLIVLIVIVLLVILYNIDTHLKNKKAKRFFLFRFASWVARGFFGFCEVLAAGVSAIGRVFGFREEETFVAEPEDAEPEDDKPEDEQK